MGEQGRGSRRPAGARTEKSSAGRGQPTLCCVAHCAGARAPDHTGTALGVARSFNGNSRTGMEMARRLTCSGSEWGGAARGAGLLFALLATLREAASRLAREIAREQASARNRICVFVCPCVLCRPCPWSYDRLIRHILVVYPAVSFPRGPKGEAKNKTPKQNWLAAAIWPPKIASGRPLRAAGDWTADSAQPPRSAMESSFGVFKRVGPYDLSSTLGAPVSPASQPPCPRRLKY